MAVKVAINGFGRIGRNVLRAIIESGRTDIEVVALNDLGPVETNAHLMRYDSVHGRFPGTVTVNGDSIDVGRGPIRVTAIRNPAELPWGDVDIALECTGIFATREKASIHLQNGSKRVLVSAPAGGAIPAVDETSMAGLGCARQIFRIFVLDADQAQTQGPEVVAPKIDPFDDFGQRVQGVAGDGRVRVGTGVEGQHSQRVFEAVVGNGVGE